MKKNTFTKLMMLPLLIFLLGLSNVVTAQGDACATAVAVTPGTYVADGPSTGAGAANMCYTSATNADWYVYTATADGTIDVSSCLGGADTRLSVYTGTCGSLTCYANTDDDCEVTAGGSSYAASLTGVSVTAGTTYYIEWDDKWSSSGFTWTLTFTPPPSCPDPTSIMADIVTDNSATISWTTGGSTIWNIQYDTAGFTFGNGIMVTGTTMNPYTITGLSSQTDYEFYVQDDCGTSQSNWVGPFSFTTACLPVTAPVFESFDNSTLTACWLNYAEGTDDWEIGGNPGYGASGTPDHTGNGGGYAWVDGSTPTHSYVTLETPFIDVSGLTTPFLDFWVFSNNTNYPGDNNPLYVEFYNGANWDTILTYAADNPDWVNILIDLSTYNIVGPIKIAFTVNELLTTNSAYYNDILLDDISVMEAPACPNPSLLTAMNISAISADLGWNSLNGTSWNLQFDTAGFVLGSVANITATTNPYTVTGLVELTAYEFYVQDVCGTDSSDWIGPYTFTTPAYCPDPSGITADVIGANTATISWTTGGASTWNIEYDTAGFAPGTGIMVTGTTMNPYTISGLMSNSDYEFYVQDDCGVHQSNWIGPFSFTTACDALIAPWADGFENQNTFTNANWGDCWSSNPAGSTSPYRWNVDGSGSTPSSSTGPSGANTGSNYAYTEASSGSTGAVAELLTPMIDLSGLISPALSFYYHMYGTAMGELHVDIFDGTTWVQDIMPALVGQQQTSSSDPFIMQVVDLSSYTGIIQLKFRSLRGSSYTSDVCLDDISIYESAVPPTCATTFTPADLTMDVPLEGALSWSGASNADGYILYFGTDNPPTNIADSMDIGAVTSFAGGNLSYATTYFWSVVPYNALGTGSACTVQEFTTMADPTITSFPWLESFNAYPILGWNTGGTKDWAQYSGSAMYANFWSWSSGNAELITPPVALNIDLILFFNWSHLYNSSYPDDSMAVCISTDNGLTWMNIWGKGGMDLNSNDGAGNTSPGSYVTEQIDLSTYTGSTVLFKFDAHSGYGPNLYLDEVKVSSDLPGMTCADPLNYGAVNATPIVDSTSAAITDLWYTFDVPANYIDINVSLCGSVFDTYLEIYDACGASVLAYNDDYCGTQSEVFLGTIAAGTYYAKISGYSTSDYGVFNLAVTGVLPGAQCEWAMEAFAGTNSADGSDQWFYYVPMITGPVNITSCITGQSEDTKLYIYDACGGTQLAYDDDAYCSAYNYASEVDFNVVSGDTIYIFWDSYWGPGAFDFVITENGVLGCMDMTAQNYNPLATMDDGSCEYPGCTDPVALNYDPMANFDDGTCYYPPTCANAIDYGLINSGTVTADLIYAGDAAWYMFTLDDEYANVSVSLCGSNFDTRLEVWQSCNASTFIGYNDDNFNACGVSNASQVDFTSLQAGTYFAKIYGYYNEFGTFDLTITGDLLTPWPVIVTGGNHTIFIQNPMGITIDGNPVQVGDYIGVFYTDSNGDLACGGISQYDGAVNTIAAWADDTETTAKDGFASGEVFTWKIYSVANQMEYDAVATYLPFGFPPMGMPNDSTFFTNGLSAITALAGSTPPPSPETQSIVLNMGWSLFSTYIDVTGVGIDVAMSSVSASVELVKNGSGMSYFPAWFVNQIGNMVVGEAYQVKMNQAETLDVVGYPVDPAQTSVSVPSGWSYLGYLRTGSADIAANLSGIVSDINIVKNDVGQVYWPTYNLNSIGDMIPGEGYQVKMNNAASLTYPANASKSNIIPQAELMYFDGIQNTGSNMILGIPVDAWNIEPTIGDEIAVFNLNNELVGATVYNGEFTSVAIWGDDNTTDQIENIVANQKFNVKIWKTETDQIQNVELVSFIEGNDLYTENGVTVVGKALVGGGDEFVLHQNKPNPFSITTNIEFYVPSETLVQISVYNILGEQMSILTSEIYGQGTYTIDFNANDFASGVYYYKVVAGEFSETKQMTISK